MLYCSGASSENAKTMNTILFILRSGMRLRFSPTVDYWLTCIPILPRSPLWARFSHASNLTFHLTRPTSPIMRCWNNVSFSVAIDLLVFFVYTLIPVVFEWEVLELLTLEAPGVEFQMLVRSDVVFIKLQTAQGDLFSLRDLHWPA